MSERSWSIDNPYIDAWVDFDDIVHWVSTEDHLKANVWQDGFDKGSVRTELYSAMEKKVDQMENLLAANARVLRQQIEEEIRKEIENVETKIEGRVGDV